VKKVVFACVHNAGRSQIAAAFFNAIVDPVKACAYSAGTQPAEKIHPEVEAVMREVGFDLIAVKPQKLTAELLGGADMLVTMGCGEQCPFVPGLRTVDWVLEDPKDQPIAKVRQIRDQIRARVVSLIADQKFD